MAYKIMVAIQKGGVGKTTTTVMVAELLAASGRKVLVLDLDSQGNATQMLTGESIYKNSGKTIFEAVKEMNPKKYILSPKENIDLLPSDDMLSQFDKYIYQDKRANPVRTLYNALRAIESDYDYILMDCPPNLGGIVLNAIAYSDYIIAPINPDAFGMDALERFIDNVNETIEKGHSKAELLGILFTLREKRNSLEKTIGTHIRESYGDAVFKTEIHKRARLKEFAFAGVDISTKKDLKLSSDYIDLVEEIVERIEV